MGDPTARQQGRVTLNLIKHFTPVGSALMVFTAITGFGLGWGKPAPINPRLMRNPRLGTFLSVAAGPLSNLLQALIFAVVLRIFVSASGMFSTYGFLASLQSTGNSFTEIVGYIPFYGILVNISLMLFNLIPIGLLDGHWLVGVLLPEPARTNWFYFNRRLGFVGLIVLVVVLNRVDFLEPVLLFFMRPLIGQA